jgi:RimJ/RimL family protein N-acetyltransferase
MPMLSDGLVHLRKLESTDLERTWHWINRPDVYLKIGSQVPVSHSAQQKWFERTDAAQDKIVMAVCLDEGAVHVGNVSLDSIEPRHRTARLSIFIGEADERGRALGSRALRLLAHHAFDHLNLNRIWCKAAADDERIERFYQRLGFRKEGVLRQHEFVDGHYVDKAIYGLLRDEFEQPPRTSGH